MEKEKGWYERCRQYEGLENKHIGLLGIWVLLGEKTLQLGLEGQVEDSRVL